MPRLRPGLILCGSAFLVAALLPLATTALAQAPCDQPERRQLDFWIGSWRLVDRDGREIARSRVSSQQGGCLLVEELEAGAISGLGMTYFDPSTGAWKQHWVDNRGRIARYRGTLRNNRAQLIGEQVAADGSVEQAKMTLELAADGRVLHRVELSVDAGRTWEVAFDGAYASADQPTDSFSTAQATPSPKAQRRRRERRAEAPPPAPAPPSKPAAQPAHPPPASERVKAVSRTAEIDELEQRATIQMASPMTLRLPLGSLDKLPAGYAWSSDETAYYVSQGASIPRVRVTPSSRGGKVRLKVVVALRSERYSQRVAVAAALVPAGGGAAYVTRESGRLVIGRSTTNQASQGFTERTIELELDRETFDRLFASEERPSLEVTLTLL